MALPSNQGDREFQKFIDTILGTAVKVQVVKSPDSILYDDNVITRNAKGNPTTSVFKYQGVTVLTFTYTYNAKDELIRVQVS